MPETSVRRKLYEMLGPLLPENWRQDYETRFLTPLPDLVPMSAHSSFVPDLVPMSAHERTFPSFPDTVKESESRQMRATKAREDANYVSRIAQTPDVPEYLRAAGDNALRFMGLHDFVADPGLMGKIGENVMSLDPLREDYAAQTLDPLLNMTQTPAVGGGGLGAGPRMLTNFARVPLSAMVRRRGFHAPKPIVKARDVVVENNLIKHFKNDPVVTKEFARAIGEPDLKDPVQLLDRATEVLKTHVKDRHVFVRVPDDTVMKAILDDGYYKTQFESGESGGFYGPETRARAEKNMFGHHEAMSTKARPVYGYIGEDPAEFAGSVSGYGDIVIKMRPEVRARTTFTIEDSLNPGLTASAEGYYPPYGRPVPLEAPTKHVLGSMIRLFNTRASGRSFEIDKSRYPELDLKNNFEDWIQQYPEAQIHGGVKTSDIEKVLIPVMGSARSTAAVYGDLIRRLEKKRINWGVWGYSSADTMAKKLRATVRKLVLHSVPPKTDAITKKLRAEAPVKKHTGPVKWDPESGLFIPVKGKKSEKIDWLGDESARVRRKKR